MNDSEFVIPRGVVTRLKCPLPINPGVYGVSSVVCKTKAGGGDSCAAKTTNAIKQSGGTNFLNSILVLDLMLTYFPQSLEHSKNPLYSFFGDAFCVLSESQE